MTEFWKYEDGRIGLRNNLPRGRTSDERQVDREREQKAHNEYCRQRRERKEALRRRGIYY